MKYDAVRYLLTNARETQRERQNDSRCYFANVQTLASQQLLLVSTRGPHRLYGDQHRVIAILTRSVAH